MTSKELVLAALNHQQTDRVPIDFGSTAVTGIHVYAVAALRDYYGLDKRPVKVHEPYQMLGLIEEDLMQAMGLDTVGIPAPETLFGFRNEEWKLWRAENGLEVLVSKYFNTTKDDQGNILIYPKGDLSAPASGKMPKNGFFFDTIIRQEPIDEDRLNPEDNFEEFARITEADLAYFTEESRHTHASGRAVVATFGGTAFGDIALVPAPFLRHPKGIRDIEEWYMSTLIRQDYIHRIFSFQSDIALQNLTKINERVGDLVDVVFICGTDFGTQNSTFCSEETYRCLYMPYYQKINNWIHRNTNWKTFKHSCGAVEPLIEAMIESGFDILNPVQCSALGMEAKGLKQKYGDRLVFWGGGIDTQKTIQFGTPEEVRREVLERCEVFSKGGGFVFNSVHNIQGNTPFKNIVSMIDALKEFNGVS
jgi:uroporphyrinogen-III decarboxylase